MNGIKKSPATDLIVRDERLVNNLLKTRGTTLIENRKKVFHSYPLSLEKRLALLPFMVSH
jgi:hypothetical protein